MSVTPPTTAQIDAFRDRADGFIRDLDAEFYAPLRRAQEHARRRGGLRGVRGCDAPRDRAVDAGRAHRAVALRLRGLSRQPHARPSGTGRPGRGRAGDDGRRRDRSLPDAPRRDGERARARTPRTARGRATRAPRRAAEPDLPRRRADRPRGRPRARRPELLRAVPAIRVPPARARRRVPRAPRRDGATVGARRRPALPQPARDRPRRGSLVGHRAALPRAGARRELSERPHAAGARADARRPRHRPTRPDERRTSTSSRARRSRRGRSARRSRCPAR